MGYTTVRLREKTKTKLGDLKNFEKESFEDVIIRLVNQEEEPLEESELAQIEKSLKAIKEGKTLSLEEAEKEWGI